MRVTDTCDDNMPLQSLLKNDLRVTHCDDLRTLLGSERKRPQ
jgi:hypothetical protein